MATRKQREKIRLARMEFDRRVEASRNAVPEEAPKKEPKPKSPAKKTTKKTSTKKKG